MLRSFFFVAREAAMWELEERHLQEKHQLHKQQLKDQYFMQRHQLLKRHEKVRTNPFKSVYKSSNVKQQGRIMGLFCVQEMEQMHRYNQRLIEEMKNKQTQERTRLPKIQRSDAKTRMAMFKKSLRISTTAVTPDLERERVKQVRTEIMLLESNCCTEMYFVVSIVSFVLCWAVCRTRGQTAKEREASSTPETRESDEGSSDAL